MKIVIISDTHGRHEELGVLQGDILIHCGDVCEFGFEGFLELDAIDQWFVQQRFSTIICIGGNHDFPLMWEADRGKNMFQNAIYLQDVQIEFEGLIFYGAPWVPYMVGSAFFQEETKLKEKWAQIPSDIDVLITHTPPLQILDLPYQSQLHQGCPHLREKVEIVHPKLHCFGHIHASYGQKKIGETIFVNAANASIPQLKHPITIEIK